MVMPHLILARTKSSNDGSINKTVSRRLDQWIKGEYEELYTEAKALQDRLTKTRAKRAYNELKEFDQNMTEGKFQMPSEAFRTK